MITHLFFISLWGILTNSSRFVKSINTSGQVPPNRSLIENEHRFLLHSKNVTNEEIISLHSDNNTEGNFTYEIHDKTLCSNDELYFLLDEFNLTSQLFDERIKCHESLAKHDFTNNDSHVSSSELLRSSEKGFDLVRNELLREQLRFIKEYTWESGTNQVISCEKGDNFNDAHFESLFKNITSTMIEV